MMWFFLPTPETAPNWYPVAEAIRFTWRTVCNLTALFYGLGFLEIRWRGRKGR